MNEESVKALVEEYQNWSDEELVCAYSENDCDRFGDAVFEAMKRVAAERNLTLLTSEELFDETWDAARQKDPERMKILDKRYNELSDRHQHHLYLERDGVCPHCGHKGPEWRAPGDGETLQNNPGGTRVPVGWLASSRFPIRPNRGTGQTLILKGT